MAESKKYKVGEIVDVKEGAVIRRPDGTEVTSTGGVYVLDVPGTHTVGDEEIKVS